MLTSRALVVSCFILILFFAVAPQLSSVAPAFSPSPYIGSTCSSTKACPIGVADYGVNGKVSPPTKYSYVAQQFSSWVNFTSLVIGGDGQMSIQQNTVDYKVYEKGHSGVYWIQDVPVVIQTSSGHFTIQQNDNIWNLSSGSARMSGKIFPNLDGGCTSTGGQPKFYYCVGNTFATTLPFEVNTLVRTGKVIGGTYNGHSAVSFAIFVYHKGVLVGGSEFDAVAFAGTAAATPNFKVGGFNPYGIYNDAETVLAGNCCGSTIAITSIGAHISEGYSLAFSGGPYTSVPHAYSAGYDTAEKVTGVHMKSSVSGVGIAASGADNNVPLW